MGDFDERANVAVDVIVATRNRPQDFAKLVPTLLAQTHANFRCFIVDQSEDTSDNAAIVSAAADPRLVHLVHRATGKSKALNLGIAKSTASILAFTDDDCTLPPDWLDRIVAAVARLPAPGVVFGNVLAADFDPAEWYVPAIEFERHAILATPLLRSPGLIGMGANMAVSRAVFERAGTFDEDLGPGGLLKTGEECELAYRALRLGLVVSQDPEVEVLHWGARPVENDVARQLVTTGFFAIGAGYGKHIRGGDWRAVAVTLHESASMAVAIARAVARRRGPFHVTRLATFWKGIAAGTKRGPNVPAIARDGTQG